MENNITIQELEKSVQSLSSDMSFFETWYLIATILIAIISLFALFENRKSSKASLLHQVKNSIDDAKTQIENLTLQFSELKSKKKLTADEERQKEIQNTIYNSAIEKLLNAYEDGCQKYFANDIVKEEFKKSYHSDIREYVENFSEKFREPLTKYNFMLRVHKEWYKID